MGHTVIAENLGERLALDIVTWVPAGAPPHKDAEELTPAIHRLNMVKLAIDGNPLFEVFGIELSESQPPWTVDLLGSFKRDYPQDELHLLIGGDSLVDLVNWRNYTRLWELAEIDVAARPGWDSSGVDSEILDNVRIVDCPLVDVSGTEIRRNIAAGRSVEGLVSESVLRYINRYELYR